ncbi:30S ribosomal protein S31, chloroplastic [Carica papaya]|uniref:30S ribosomal protein S31, chloroplastic n=1 Tax=Carica papaya TaxID=3649 RepID=UPI000B8CFF79|nr:30S ribosomal protein S31, chloroplastic [Carica papaya]
MASLLLRAPPIFPLTLPLCTYRISSSHSETLGTSLTCSSTPSSLSATSSCSPLFVYCGRGDKKTAKGKRFNHSFGNARPRDKKKGRGPPRIPVPSSPPKLDRFEDDEKVKIEIDESLL